MSNREKPSTILRNQAAALRHPHDDHPRTALLMRAWDLQRSALLSQQHALQDLSDAGYFHVQPCYCEKCR